MRALAAILLLLAAAPAWSAQTYEVRSALHVVTVDLEGEGETREYAVRVSDAQSGALLVVERLSAQKRQARVQTDTNLSILVHAGEMNGTLTLSLQVRNNSVMVDSINANFLIKSHPGIVGVPPPPLPPTSVRREQRTMEGVHRVGGEVKAPVVISRVEPLFSEEARKARVAGIVILEAVIDEQGNVQDAAVLKPLPFGLDQAALDAVRQWKFRPGTLDGVPVKVLFNLTINFKLPNEEPQG